MKTYTVTMLRSVWLLIIVVAFSLANTVNAQQTVVSYWNQNSNEVEGNFGFAPSSFPQLADSGNGQITIGNFNDSLNTDGLYQFIPSFAGTVDNALDDDEAGGSFSPQGAEDNSNNGMYFDISVDLTGKENIMLSWAQRGTGTGFDSRVLSYSTNGGETFTEFDENTGALTATWVVVSHDFSAVTSLNNNPNAVFRLILDGATSATGNNRFDNILVQGEQMAEATDPITVTFRVNTSTVADTLKTTDNVFIRGAFKIGDAEFAEGDYNGQNISWGTTLPMTNVGGDNWELDVTINPGDAVKWKYFPQFAEGGNLAIFDDGWEAGSDRLVEVNAFQTENMTLDLAYWSNGNTPPYTTAEDSVTLYFRVNVGAFVQDGQFDPETDQVGIRGVPEVFLNPADWGSTAIYLTQEGRTANSGDNWFYSGVARVADADVANFTDPVPYKFVLETGAGVVWDDNAGANDGNRFVTIPAEDATIPWVYMQNKKPTEAEIVTLTANFQVNVAILEGLGFFDSGIGDQVVTRGELPLDWGTNEANTMIFDDEDVVYRLSREMTRAVDSSIKYKYYIDYDASRTDPESPNFIQAIADNVDFGYEEPVTTGGADRLFTFTDETVQSTGAEFYNGVPYAGIIFGENTPDGSLELTFRIDMTPALSHSTPFNPADHKVYIQFESKYTALTQGFASGGVLFDDATTEEEVEFLQMVPEEEGSDIYAITFDLEFPTINDFGFVVRYGSVLGEEPMVVNGSGFDAGRRYFQFIEPVSVEETGFDPFFGQTYDVQWPATYTMALLEWKENDLPFDVQPDYAALSVSVDDRITEAPNSFKLEQNYPNPFNPSTNINFTLPTASDVTLTVYNVLGQKVATLVNGRMNAGAHGVRFDASNLASGIYFYRLQTNNFVQQRSMTLIK